MRLENNISIDFETYSEADLKKTGAYKYINDPSFEKLCFAYSINFEKTKLWTPGQPSPIDVCDALASPEFHIRGMNVGFERYIINRELSFFNLKKRPKINRYIDTQALAGYYGLPLALENCGKALNLDILKDKRGKYLINKLTKPKKWSNATPFTRWTPENAFQDFKDFYEYCIQDVNAEQAILKALPSMFLPPQEQIIWQHTIIQNERGVYIDLPLVKNILKVQKDWSVKTTEKLKKFTGGIISTGNQTAKFIELSNKINYPIPNMQVGTVDQFLEDPDCPKKLKKLLGFRKLLSKNSTAKFKKMTAMINPDNTIKDNLQYYGTVTGRYAARGIQMQNLPAKKSKKPDELIEAFNSGDLEEVEKGFGNDVMGNASKLIRLSLIAPPGYDLVVSDFSSIENRGLHWLAGDYKTLREFENGLDQYITFASTLFNIPYGEITSEQRAQGKTAILGLGYQMGWKTYHATCHRYGINISIDRAKYTVKLYRKKYALVVRLWEELYAAAYKCVEMGGTTKYNRIKFKMGDDRLYMVLPTGRSITYTSPRLSFEEMPWGEEKKIISFMGIDSYTKKWSRLGISPGRLTENADQGLSRDILTFGAINVEKAGYKVCGSIHDEVYSIYPEGKADIDYFDRLICKMPEELNLDIPLEAKGYISKRYKKN